VVVRDLHPRDVVHTNADEPQHRRRRDPVAGDLGIGRADSQESVPFAVDQPIPGDSSVLGAEDGDVRPGKATDLKTGDGNVLHGPADGQHLAVFEHEGCQLDVLSGDADPCLGFRASQRSGKPRAVIVDR